MKFVAVLLIGVSWGISQPCIRMNQLGYLPKETKTAFIFSHDDLGNSEFSIFDRISGRQMMSGPLWLLERSCAHFKYAYQLNFTALRTSGAYALMVGEGDSTFFRIGSDVYSKVLLHPLHYIYSQRCGNFAEYNRVCHQLDANAIDGPDAGKHLDLIGGYHESAGYVRFLGTTSYVVGVLLMSYKDFPGIWSDACDLQGKPQSNNVPDILDEAQWGLNWMLKMASEPGKLFSKSGMTAVLPVQLTPIRIPLIMDGEVEENGQCIMQPGNLKVVSQLRIILRDYLILPAVLQVRLLLLHGFGAGNDSILNMPISCLRKH
jgi:hypothetical protein